MMTGKATIRTMQLQVLSYERLLARDSEEVQKLVDISCSSGIFFLDLRGSSAKDFLADQLAIIQAQRIFFAQESKAKLAYASDLEGRG
jgi:hypothetical protein